jgi:hypothetical protein
MCRFRCWTAGQILEIDIPSRPQYVSHASQLPMPNRLHLIVEYGRNNRILTNPLVIAECGHGLHIAGIEPTPKAMTSSALAPAD